jgi:phosphoglycerate dehydrogenase-like enzyme
MSATILIVLNPDSVSKQALERIHSVAPNAHLVITDRAEEIEPLLDQVEVAAGDFSSGWIERAPRLRWCQQWGAGVDWLLHHPEIAMRDFILTNASGVHAIPISEHILAFLLAFARCLPAAIRAQEQHNWGKADHPPVFELAGKTMLLVGVGAIGQRTAQLASALGMRVLGIRHNPSKNAPGIERMFGPGELESVLPNADFLVLTIPLTQQTRGLIGAQAFARMKPSAYLINIGRGGTVDEPALIHALQTGQIAGAGLDVFTAEPLPPDSPLWDMQNVIITAHYSGNTPYYDERALDLFIDNLQRYMNGRQMRNVVDKKRGY